MALSSRLESLTKKHLELENAIHAMELQPLPDELALKRLKTEKLAIKDEIAALSSHVLEAAE